MKRPSISKGMRVRQAIETLFEGFRGSDRGETAWARRLLLGAEPSHGEVQAEILTAIARYCPNVPAEFVPFIVDLLAAGIRLARREEDYEVDSAGAHPVFTRATTDVLRESWCNL